MAVTVDDGAIEAMLHDPDGPVAQLMERKAYATENAAKTLMLSSGGGGVYEPGVKFFRRGKKVYRWERSSAHEASAPGAPAASDMGDMLGHFGHEMEDTADGMSAVVYNDSDHALYVELGTRYMAPRPTLRPALDIGINE